MPMMEIKNTGKMAFPREIFFQKEIISPIIAMAKLPYPTAKTTGFER